MKKIISITLSIIMMLSAVFCVDLSAYATEVNSAIKSTTRFVNNSFEKLSVFSSDAFSNAKNIFSAIELKPLTAAVTTYTSGDFEYTVDSNGNATITKYNGNSSDINIPSILDEHIVTVIGENVFKDKSDIVSVSFPNTINIISNAAFSGCSSIQELNLPTSLSTIGTNAFLDCTSLTTLFIPKSLNTIGTTTKVSLANAWDPAGRHGPFSGCSNLKNVVFETGVTSISSSLLTNTGIESITIPDTVTSLSDYCLAFCYQLETVILPESLLDIGFSAFCGDVKLDNIILPTHLKHLDSYAFLNCKSLSYVKIPKSLTSVEYYDGWTALPWSPAAPFEGCVSLKNIEFESGTTVIPQYIFAETEIESFEIPEGVKTIQQAAFFNCKKLIDVKLPSTLKSIGVYAFRGCSSLKSIVIPSGVTTLQGNCFAGCSELVNLTINASITEVNTYDGYTSNSSYPFAGCSKLNNINLSSVVSTIPSYLFASTGLKSISIPSTIKSIEAGAFYNCTYLTDVNLYDGITTIGGSAFAKTAIERIVIPDSVTGMGTYCFSECKQLSNIKLPNSRKNIMKNMFYGCQSLTRIDLPDTVTTIQESAFEKSGITYISLPNSVTTIEKNAFKNCSELNSVSLPNSLSSLAVNAFDNCAQNFKLYCGKYTSAIKCAIDNNIDVEINDETYNDSDKRPIVKNQSDYYISSDSASVNGYITLTCDYAIKSSLYSKLTDLDIWVRVPSNCNLVEDSIRLDGKKVTNSSGNDNNLYIPIDGHQSGTITFCVEPNSDAKVRSYAAILYTDSNNKRWYSLFGAIIEDFPVMSISAPQKTSTGNVTVTGIAPKSSNIEISVNDEVVSTVKSSKTGRYTATITVDKSYNLKESTVKATSLCTAAKANNTDNQEVSASTKVQYNYKAPEIYQFKMDYNDDRGRHSLDLLDPNTSAKVLYYWPKYIPRFELKFESNKYIDKLYVVSTRNGVKKYLEAQWNAGLGCWVAEGYFDPANPTTYVPGKISFEYTNKYEKQEIGADIDFTNSIVSESIADIKDKVKVSETSEGEYTFDFGSELGDLAGEELKMVVKESNENLSDFVDIYSDYENVIKYFTKDGEGKEFGINLHANAHELFGAIHDVAGSKTVEYVLTLGDEYSNLYEFVDTLGTVSKATGLLSDYYGIIDDDKELRERIDAADMNYKERAEALKKADDLQNDRMAFLLISTCIGMVAATVGTGGMAAPALMFSLMLGSITSLSSFVYDYRMDSIVGGGINLKWIIDPSGYVYEATPTNRIESVKCTIYYKEKANDTPVIWNAGEYEQENPLYTNYEGKYAWDVPEGLWQVKYEKAGYKTVYSEWMEVPPPQTDVNVSMVSTSAPKVEYVNYYTDYVYVFFDKYVDEKTLNSDNISLTDRNGKAVPFTVKYLDEAPNSLNNASTICKEIMLVPTNKLTVNGTYTLSVNPNVKSYSDVKINNYSLTDKVTRTPSVSVSESSLMLTNGESREITVNVDNAENCKLMCHSSNDIIATVNNSVTVNEGKAVITVSGAGTGYALINIAIENSNISKTIYVSCDEEVPSKAIVIDSEKIVLGTKSTYTVKPVLYPTTETQKFTYESNNAAVATVDSKGVITAVSEGNAKITVMDANSSAYNEINVTVVKKICEHNWTNTVTRATLSANGAVNYKCSVCGETKTEEIAYPKTISLSKSSMVYSGKVQKPAVTVLNANGEIIAPSDYTVTYAKGCKKVGSYKVAVTFKGNYSGTKALTYIIVPKGTSLKKPVRAKKAFTVKWKKQATQTTGYQIQYSRYKSFKKSKTVTVKGAKKTSKKITKLARKKTYYVRIRTYKTVGGKKYYSKWSAKKSVKTK